MTPTEFHVEYTRRLALPQRSCWCGLGDHTDPTHTHVCPRPPGPREDPPVYVIDCEDRSKPFDPITNWQLYRLEKP